MHPLPARPSPYQHALRLALASLAAAAVLGAGAAQADAATVTKVKDGTLLIQGDGNANAIAIGLKPGAPDFLRVDVGDDGTAEFSVRRDKFTAIQVKGGDGADRLRVDESAGAFTASEQTTIDGEAGNDLLTGGSGPEVLLGGDGNDTADPRQGADVAFLGAGQDTALWNPGDGSDAIEGQSGADTLAFHGSAAAEQLTLTANGGRLRMTRDVSAVTLDADDLEQVSLAALGGADTITVDDLSATDVTQVTPDLAGPLGGGDGQADALFVAGTPGDDAIAVGRTAGTIDPTVSGLKASVTAVHTEPGQDKLTILARPGADKVTPNESDGALAPLTISGGDGDDALTGTSGVDTLIGDAGDDTLLGKGGADALSAGDGNDTLTGGDGDDRTLLGGPGDDTIVWNPGDDSDTAEGGDGSDRLEVNGGNGAESFTVTPNGTRTRVDRVTPAPFSQDLGAIEHIAVNGNGGDDTIAGANGLAPLAELILDGGAGLDTITGGDGDDVIRGGDDKDTITPGRGQDLALMGAGDDTAIWNPGDASDTIEGQAGTDTLAFHGSGAAESIDLTANGGRLRLTRDIAAVTMDADDVEHIGVAALAGADTIRTGDLTGTDVSAVTTSLASTLGGSAGDGALDRVIATGTAGADAISVSGSSGDAIVSGLSAAVAALAAEPSDTLEIETLAGADTVDSSGLAAGSIQLSVKE